MIAAGGRPPIGDTLEFSLTEAGDGWAAFEGLPGRHAYNPIGTVHGGYAATLLDSACGCAVHSKLSAKQAYTTLELKVSYHRPPRRLRRGDNQGRQGANLRYGDFDAFGF
jgi:uncharacterized protein (TIGR00369 family)